MTAHRYHASSDPMQQRGPIQPMSAHDEYLAGFRPSFPYARFLGGVAVLAVLAVAGTLLCVALG